MRQSASLTKAALVAALGMAASGCSPSAVPAPASSPAARAPDNPTAALARSSVMLMVLQQYFDGDELGSVEGSGSGFVVDVDGQRAIATAAHVVRDASEIQVLHGSGFRTEVTGLLALDLEADLAVLAVDELPAQAVAVALSKERPELADEVVLVSSPLGLDTTVSTGSVAAFRPELRAFQLAAGVSPGSSGGLVAGRDGRVIGVIRSKAPTALGGEGIALITPSRRLSRILGKAEHRPLPDPPDRQRLVTIATHVVTTGPDSPFESRAAAGGIEWTADSRPLEHYCLRASDPRASVALGEAEGSVDEPRWRLGTGHSCGTFTSGQPIHGWIGTDRPGATIHVTLQRQK